MVDAGLIGETELERALAEQARTGRPLGEILVQGGYVSGPAVANALAIQYGGVLRTEYGVAAGPALVPVPDPPEETAPEAVRVEVRDEPTLVVVGDEHAAPDARDRTISELRQALAAAKVAIAFERAEAEAALHAAREELEAARAAEAPRPKAQERHLLFVPSPAGYSLVEQAGPAPVAGGELELDDGARFRVLRVGTAPLPGRRVACAYLERL